MIKYGKSYGNIAKLKEDFITDNRTHLMDNARIANIYQKQPERNNCKLCMKKLDKNISFKSHGLQYYICPYCGHINGAYEETFDFTSQIYEKSDYGKNYRVNEKEIYQNRLENIYIPKVDFMEEVFRENNIPFSDMDFCDFGAGSGYFVGAMLKSGLRAKGIEVSSDQVRYGNEVLGKECLTCVSQEYIVDEVKQCEADVISFIGVLEHIINLHEILNAIAENDRIKYIYFSVPIFSYSVLFESVNEDIFNRQLGGAHTHLFSEDSVNYLCDMYLWNKLGEWRFGTDAADLLRTIMVKMESIGNNSLIDILGEKYNAILDGIQLLMDKEHFCSEIHVLAEKKH